MPAVTLYTREAARRKAQLIITSLALSKLRLFKSGLTLNEFTTRAQLIAAETTATDYPAGGFTLTAWLGPANGPAGGAQLTSPTITFQNDQDPSDPPPSDAAGWWVEDATGNVRIAGTFDPVKVFTSLYDQMVWLTQIIEGLNVSQE